MTGQRSAAELADTAYEAVRALNHATLPARCQLTDHEDLYHVAGSLAAQLRVTPQALRQVADWVAREQQAGRVSVDEACQVSPPTTVAVIVTELCAAAEAVAHAARRVDRAHQAAAHLITEPAHELDL